MNADQLAEKVRRVPEGCPSQGTCGLWPEQEAALDALLAHLAEAETRATFWRDEADALLARLAEAKDTLAACQASAAVLAEGSLDQRSRAERAEKRLAEAEKEAGELQVLTVYDIRDVKRRAEAAEAERDRLKADALLAGSHLDWLIGYLDIDAADDWMVAALKTAKAARAVLARLESPNA